MAADSNIKSAVEYAIYIDSGIDMKLFTALEPAIESIVKSIRPIVNSEVQDALQTAKFDIAQKVRENIADTIPASSPSPYRW